MKGGSKLASSQPLRVRVLFEWFIDTEVHLFLFTSGSSFRPITPVDVFCGRVPRSVLARHYTDFSPKKLKEFYDKANLKVLGLKII